MSKTAIKGLWPTTAPSTTLFDDDPEQWQTLAEPECADSDYASLKMLHCADLASMPIFLSYEQAAALDEIRDKNLSGPRGKMEILPEE